MFDRHHIIYSEGVATESFYPGSWSLGAAAEDTRSEIISRFPELAEPGRPISPVARPLLSSREASVLFGT